MAWNVLATGIFILAFGALTARWLAESGVPLPAPLSAPLPERSGVVPGRETLWKVFEAALLFRLAVALGGLVIYNAISGGTAGLAELPGLWTRWDAPHYIKLIELGYSGYQENGQPLFLVFYPLYVWLTRAVRVIVPNTAVAGMVVSFLCFGWGSVYVYRLGAEEYGERTARTALALLWSFPFAFFFGGIMTESLFLLTTAGGLYHIRRHQWGRAGLWGILAAMTRMQGVLLIGAAIAELFNAEKPFSLSDEKRKNTLLSIAKKAPLLLSPVLGSLAYFGLNYHVAGDPFAFTVMQRHWNQGFMWFPAVLKYLAQNAFGWQNVTVRWEMWGPELVLFPLFAFLLWRGWKKHRSMLTLYGTVYFILNYCLSWLLSAGRYLSCTVPAVFIAADELEEKPGVCGFLVGIMLSLQMVLLYRYFCWGQVM